MSDIPVHAVVTPPPESIGPRAHDPFVKHQFDDMPQQRTADTLGMWTFLATEVLFFGGVICSYIIYRNRYPADWVAGSKHLMWYLGTINTIVLLTSSFFVAL